MAYFIIGLEGRELIPEGRVLFVKANPVKDAGESFRFLEEMFGKKYYNYSLTEDKETDYFVFPFSENLLQELKQINRSSLDPESYDSYWNPILSDFYRDELYDEGAHKTFKIYKHKSFKKTQYEFCIFTDLLTAKVNGEKLFLVHTNRTRIEDREAYLKDANLGVICYFVFAASEYKRFKEETSQAFWRPDLSHYFCEELEMSGVNRFTGAPVVEKRYMYISHDVSYNNILENLSKLPL